MASDREIRANTEILGEEIGRKSGLGKSAKYRSATFTVRRRKSRGGIIHGILAFSSITLGEPRRWRECFLRQWGGANEMRGCGKLSLRWPIWEPRDGSTVDTRRNLLPVRLAVCSLSAVQCLLLWSVTSPLSPRALLRCLKHSRILSRGSQDRSLCFSD